MPSSNSSGMPGVAPGGATSGIPGSAAPTGIPGRAVASLGNASSGAWVNFTVSATLKKALSSPGFNIDAPAASANSFQGAVQGGVPGAMPPGVGTGASPIPGASATPGAMPPGAGTGASPIPGAR